MSLPVSSSFRICTSCDGPIDIGTKYGLDPNGDVVCEDCIPSESLEQYADDDAWLEMDEWDDYDDDLAYEDAW